MILFISLTLIFNVILLIFLIVSRPVSSTAPACRFETGINGEGENTWNSSGLSTATVTTTLNVQTVQYIHREMPLAPALPQMLLDFKKKKNGELSDTVYQRLCNSACWTPLLYRRPKSTSLGPVAALVQSPT